MKQREIMSYGQQIRLLKTSSGICWLFVGFFGCFKNDFFMVLQLIGILICAGLMFGVMFAKREDSDEMSDTNLHQAKSRTLDIMHNVLGLLAVFSFALAKLCPDFIDWTRFIPVAFFFSVGMQDILIGVFFRKLEDA